MQYARTLNPAAAADWLCARYAAGDACTRARRPHGRAFACFVFGYFPECCKRACSIAQVQQTAAALQADGSRVDVSTFAAKGHAMPSGARAAGVRRIDPHADDSHRTAGNRQPRSGPGGAHALRGNGAVASPSAAARSVLTAAFLRRAACAGRSASAEMRALMTFWSETLCTSSAAAPAASGAVPQTATAHLLAAGFVEVRAFTFGPRLARVGPRALRCRVSCGNAPRLDLPKVGAARCKRDRRCAECGLSGKSDWLCRSTRQHFSRSTALRRHRRSICLSSP